MQCSASIAITVCYAEPSRSAERHLSLPTGATIAVALAQLHAEGELANWGIRDNAELSALIVGIWGKRREHSATLREGDRIEIYRPLIADPKLARRRRAVGRGSRKM